MIDGGGGGEIHCDICALFLQGEELPSIEAPEVNVRLSLNGGGFSPL